MNLCKMLVRLVVSYLVTTVLLVGYILLHIPFSYLRQDLLGGSHSGIYASQHLRSDLPV